MRVHLKIYGQVQGVFFRRSAKIKADSFGLLGWIRNRKDGAVEVVAIGTEDKLKDFAAWSKKGSAFSKVEKVEESWSEIDETFEDFSII